MMNLIKNKKAKRNLVAFLFSITAVVGVQRLSAVMAEFQGACCDQKLGLKQQAFEAKPTKLVSQPSQQKNQQEDQQQVSKLSEFDRTKEDDLHLSQYIHDIICKVLQKEKKMLCLRADTLTALIQINAELTELRTKIEASTTLWGLEDLEGPLSKIVVRLEELIRPFIDSKSFWSVTIQWIGVACGVIKSCNDTISPIAEKVPGILEKLPQITFYLMGAYWTLRQCFTSLLSNL